MPEETFQVKYGFIRIGLLHSHFVQGSDQRITTAQAGNPFVYGRARINVGQADGIVGLESAPAGQGFTTSWELGFTGFWYSRRPAVLDMTAVFALELPLWFSF